MIIFIIIIIMMLAVMLVYTTFVGSPAIRPDVQQLCP